MCTVKFNVVEPGGLGGVSLISARNSHPLTNISFSSVSLKKKNTVCHVLEKLPRPMTLRNSVPSDL